MSKSEHTPGPWGSGVKPYIVPSTGEGDNFSDGDWNIFPPLGEAGPVAIVNSEANAVRIVACVNACEGIDDPGAALEELSQYARTGLQHRISIGQISAQEYNDALKRWGFQ